jgi:Ca-activated chloride channel family protein
MRASIAMVTTALLILLFYVAYAANNRVEGRVSDQLTGEPVIGASVALDGTTFGARTDVDGNFRILRVPAGTYTLRVTAIGYETCLVESLTVTDNAATVRDIKMTVVAVDLEKNIEVRANCEVIDKSVTESKTTTSAEHIKSKPALSVDYLLEQTTGVEPAQTGKVLIRGGRSGEVNYYKDGKEVRGPLGGHVANNPVSHPQANPLPLAHGGSSIVNDEPYDAMFFDNAGINPFVDTEDDHLSTFAADVDDASYILTRSYLRDGNLPDKDGVRVEEFINHFAYNYPSPRQEPFGVNIEAAPSRFGSQNSLLLRIGIQGRTIRDVDRKPANLVFVVDISGSMATGNRLELVKKSLRLLVDRLRPDDMIGIVVYGSTGRVLLESTTVRNRSEILGVINALKTNGATNAEEGIRLGYELAFRHLSPGRINRIILCSDGVANVGQTGPDRILQEIDSYRQQGITLTTIGFGMGNYNDALMERLANRGDGVYAYVDDIAEARKLLVDNLAGTLETIAKDVKLQVDFNSRTVRSYRLLGYENRDVKDAKFRDDTEDGGEIGAGHTTTALYEIKLQDQPKDDLVATVFIRYKSPDAMGTVSEVNHQVMLQTFSTRFESTSVDFKLAAAAAAFAEILRHSYWARETNISEVRQLALEVAQSRREIEVNELVELISRAEDLQQLSSKQ